MFEQPNSTNNSGNTHPYGILLVETQFWVIHRHAHYGPFDYQWSHDLRGIELLYQGEKYGECASDEEFFADLKTYSVPLKVAEVATVVSGSIIKTIFGHSQVTDRVSEIRLNLASSNLARYQLCTIS